MPTDTRRRRTFTVFRLAVAATGISAGVLILGLAVERTIAAFQLLLGDPGLESIRLGKVVSKGELETLISSRASALGWHPRGRVHSDLAVAHLELAKRNGYGGENGEGHLRAGLQAINAGLSLSPADPYGWARLAFVRIKNGASAADVKTALFLSFLTGPHEKRLAISRIQYAILLWNRLGLDERALVLDQISWADRIGNRRALVTMAKRHRNADAVIFQAIARDPKQLRGYLRSLRNCSEWAAHHRIPRKIGTERLNHGNSRAMCATQANQNISVIRREFLRMKTPKN